MTKSTDEKPQDISLTEVLQLCVTNSNFRAHMVKHPNATLKKLGFKIPKGMKFYTHVQTPQKFHLIIPPSSAQLEKEVEHKLNTKMEKKVDTVLKDEVDNVLKDDKNAETVS